MRWWPVAHRSADQTTMTPQPRSSGGSRTNRPHHFPRRCPPRSSELLDQALAERPDQPPGVGRGSALSQLTAARAKLDSRGVAAAPSEETLTVSQDLANIATAVHARWPSTHLPVPLEPHDDDLVAGTPWRPPCGPARLVGVGLALAFGNSDDGPKVVATIEVGGGPHGVAIGAGSVWVTNRDDNSVSRIDPATDEVISETTVGPKPDGLSIGENSAGDESMWVTSFEGPDLSRIDPLTNEVADTIPGRTESVRSCRR